MSDVVLLVLQLTVPSVRNADRMVGELSRQGFNMDRLKLVVNRVGKDNSSLQVEQVETTLNRKMYACLSDDWQAASNAVNMGEALCMAAGRSKLRQDIEALARRLCPDADANGDGEAVKAGSGGILSRLFSASKIE
jgi:pilus assembly protein CpaE